MEGNLCTSAGCYLQQNGGLISLPLVTIAGLVDGLNPCAIGMIILLLGYLVVFAKKPEKILPLGLAYIGTIYLTYLGVGLFFFKTATVFGFSDYRLIFDRLVGSALLVAGLINIKDYFLPQLPIHLEIPQRTRKHLFSLVEKMTVPAIILLGIIVTLLETPCSIPVYAGTAAVLAGAGLSFLGAVGYFLFYNLLFVSPLIVILVFVWKGKEISFIKELEHRAKRWSKLILGIFLSLMAIWLLFGSSHLISLLFGR